MNIELISAVFTIIATIIISIIGFSVKGWITVSEKNISEKFNSLSNNFKNQLESIKEKNELTDQLLTTQFEVISKQIQRDMETHINSMKMLLEKHGEEIMNLTEISKKLSEKLEEIREWKSSVKQLINEIQKELKTYYDSQKIDSLFSEVKNNISKTSDRLRYFESEQKSEIDYLFKEKDKIIKELSEIKINEANSLKEILMLLVKHFKIEDQTTGA